MTNSNFERPKASSLSTSLLVRRSECLQLLYKTEISDTAIPSLYADYSSFIVNSYETVTID